MPYRVLVIYDAGGTNEEGKPYGWAYWRRANALKAHAPADFIVDTVKHAGFDWKRCGTYDLVFNLEYAAPARRKIKGHSPNRNVPLVVSFNSDSQRKQDWWDKVVREADFVVCNNQDVFDAHQRMRGTCCISNGIDSEIWRPTVPISDRPHCVLWSGSTGASKGKGWNEVLRPLADGLLRRAGFDFSFRPVNEMSTKIVYPTDKMVEWYNSGSYILCASASEGTPGIISEGVACGCVAVSVPVGNIREWGRPGENCVIVQRTPEDFIQGLEYARTHRGRLSAAGAELFRTKWSYGSPGERANYFFQLFRRIIQQGPSTIPPFSYNEVDWREI